MSTYLGYANLLGVVPDHIDLHEIEQTGGRVLLRLTGDEFRAMVAFPVVVEMWDKKSYGLTKRAYEQEFDKDERTKLSRWYAKFYNWHLRTGTPRNIAISANTLAFLIRATNFFGTI